MFNSRPIQIRVRNLAARYARVVSLAFRPEKSEGAGNAGRLMRPQPRVQMKKAHERSHHGHTGIIPAFPAQWFYGLLRALPGDQACLTPSPRGKSARLDADPGASERHDFAVRTSAIRQRRRRVHRIPPHVRNVRTPL
jgi:hypothetical protein